jgi:succinate-acetate transporter protein
MTTHAHESRATYAARDDGPRERAWDGIPARIFLQPIAAPSVLGLYAFMGATLIVAAHMAGWYGSKSTPEFLFPFAAMFGGVAQFAAGMWAFKARDVLATAMHGTWGSFWMAYGILFTLAATGTVTLPEGKFSGLGFWFIALAAITAVGAVAALTESIALFGVLGTLTAGSVLAAVAFLTGSSGWETTAGWVFVVSAGLAWYTASAMMLAATAGKILLPLGTYSRTANVPGRSPTTPIELEYGEPGVKKGQ